MCTGFVSKGCVYVHIKRHMHMYPDASNEVFATVLSLLFQVPGLEFNKPLDHFEAFSRKMSVTKGEWSEAQPDCDTYLVWGLEHKDIVYHGGIRLSWHKPHFGFVYHGA